MFNTSNFFIKRKIENLIRMGKDKNLNILDKEKSKEEIIKETEDPILTEEQNKVKDNQL